MNEPVVPGQVLLGKYRVERVLGQGGMGIVVAVRHVELGQLHAMKFLLPTAVGHEESHERFLREAKAAARLSSEHAAKVQDVGRMENGAPYMVMEYLEGCDLKALVSREGPLPVEDAVTYVLQVCEAISEAHAAGIVHRDLKPANLFLVRRRNGSACVKVLDFGISKQMSADGVDLTNSNAALGSPLYMSPEQMSQSKTVDVRTDIWALGVILYELLAGTSPFRGASIPGVAARVLKEEPAPLHELCKDVPRELEAVIAKCLRKCRDERFQSVEELQEALVRFAPAGMFVRPKVSSLVPQSVDPTGALAGGETTTITFGRTGKRIAQQRLRSGFGLVFGAGLFLFIAGGIVYRRMMNAPMGDAELAVSAVSAPSISKNAQPLPEPPKSPLIVQPSAAQNNNMTPVPSSTVAEKQGPLEIKLAPAKAEPTKRLKLPATTKEKPSMDPSRIR